MSNLTSLDEFYSLRNARNYPKYDFYRLQKAVVIKRYKAFNSIRTKLFARKLLLHPQTIAPPSPNGFFVNQPTIFMPSVNLKYLGEEIKCRSQS